MLANLSPDYDRILHRIVGFCFLSFMEFVMCRKVAFVWDDKNTELVFNMWINPTKSMSDITNAFGFKSTGALYIKARKLRWPKRGKAERIKSSARNKFYTVNGISPIMGTVKMIDIKDNQCREIIGCPKNGIMCGLPIDVGSYCTCHAEKNYTPSTWKVMVKS